MVKNNETLWKILRISLTIGAILVAAAAAYGTLRERVNNNSTRVTVVETKADANAQAVVELQTDVKYIRATTDRILEKLE